MGPIIYEISPLVYLKTKRKFWHEFIFQFYSINDSKCILMYHSTFISIPGFSPSYRLKFKSETCYNWESSILFTAIVFKYDKCPWHCYNTWHYYNTCIKFKIFIFLIILSFFPSCPVYFLPIFCPSSFKLLTFPFLQYRLNTPGYYGIHLNSLIPCYTTILYKHSIEQKWVTHMYHTRCPSKMS